MSLKRTGILIVIGLALILGASLKGYKSMLPVQKSSNASEETAYAANHTENEVKSDVGAVASDTQGKQAENTKEAETVNDADTKINGNNGVEAKPEPQTAASDSEPEPKNEDTENSNQASVIPKAVEAKADSLTSSKVTSQDYLKAASTVLGKLSLGEIKYIFDSARDDYWVVTPVEEIEKARNILFSKLSEGDLDTLRQMGRKYGRSMTILQPDIDVAQVKEKRIAQVNAKK